MSMLEVFCVEQISRNTALKTIFRKSWNNMESSKIPRKYNLSINISDSKKTYFPSPKSSKQGLFSNQ